MNDALASIQQAAETRFRDVFAGVEVVPEKGYAIVYRVPSEEFDAFVRTAAGDECILVQDAAHSFADLSALQNRISGDTGYWRKRGITINTVGPMHDGSAVVVGTLDVAKARVELPKRYGTGIPITVEEAGPMVPFLAD